MAWNDTFDASTDWAALSFVRMFWDAAAERAAAALVTFPTPIGSVAGLARPALGDDVQRRAFWAHLQEFVETNYYVFANQSYDPGDPIPTATTGTVTSDSLDLSAARWATLAAFRSAAALDAAGFSRKYPREFSDAASTTYADGSAFADGHRARRRDNGFTYDRVAGAWVLTSNPVGDDPDVVTAHGLMQPGDIIGPWIFNELRDCLNLMLVVLVSLRGFESGDYEQRSQQAAPYGSTAAAQAGWAGGGGVTTSGALSGITYPYMDAVNAGGGTSFYIVVRRIRCYLTAAQQANAYAAARTIAWYALIRPEAEYSDQGTGFLQDNWNCWSMQGGLTSNAGISDWLGETGNGLLVDWPTANDTARGWLGGLSFTSSFEIQIGAMLDFSAGFTYAP